MARMSLEEAAARGRVDAAKVEALTEDDIARFNVADGFDPNDTLKGLRRVYTPAEIRERAGLTQAEMAARLTVPLKTWRNWEQGRVGLEPAVRALLALVADDHERAFQVLDGGVHTPVPILAAEDVEEAGRAMIRDMTRQLRGEPEEIDERKRAG